MVKTRSRSAPKPIPITGKDRRVITKSEEFDEIVRKACRDAKEESTVESDDVDPSDNVPPIEEYDESIGRMATDDEEKTLRHVVRDMGECFENTMILNNSKDDDQYMMTKKVDARRLVEGMGYQYNCFIKEDMKRYSIPPCEKKPVDLRHVDNLKMDKRFCESKVGKYVINSCAKSDNGSIVVSDKDLRSPSQQRGLMNVRQSKFGRDYPNISKSERVRRNARMSQYESSENESYRRFEEMRQYPVYPQYGSYRHMPMMPVYNSNVKIDAYDPKESFTLFYERFESMLLLNGVPSHLKLPMLKLHLKGRVANDVQTQREIKNDYKRLVDYLKRNYTGEESIAAARHKLSSLKINRGVDLINVGNEISRLIDVIYVEESHEDRLRRKRRHFAELLPVGIIRSLIKDNRPLCEPFDHTIFVAKDYWDDMNAGSKMVKDDKGRNERTGKFQGT
uniref:Helitron_like_N domain-containing protein n=1 Tax=Strongyloides papillosus TaxID=174720 RepID=A0A0N5BED9_STREA